MVLWNTQSVSVVNSVVGVFSVSIQIKENLGEFWWLFGIRGLCKKRDMKSFWKVLADLYGFCEDRWYLGGDFNMVKFILEKSNGNKELMSTWDQ